MRKTITLFLAIAGLLLFIWSSQAELTAQELAAPIAAQDDDNLTDSMRRFLADKEPAQDLPAMSFTACVGGMAGPYPCNNVDLLSFLPLGTFGATAGNDSWGWTDSLTGKEYAIMGVNNGTAFVDISDPVNPIYLGKLPTQTFNSSWRDIKVYNDHAFVVSEANNHGLQIFDLTELRSVASPPVTFANTAYYNGFGDAHNIVINEDSGYAYAVGANVCAGGLHMINIQNPTSPVGAGCFSGDGYTHDAQCVNYAGPDPDHQGKEICFNSNTDTLTIVDVTNKNAPVQLSRNNYSGVGYTHQGWLTPDHRYFILGDEGDEFSFGHNTRSRVWDITNLDTGGPSVIGFYDGPNASVDHNLYTLGTLVFEANYSSGLRILDGSDVQNGNLSELGYFDVYPGNNGANYNGAWSNFPYYESGVVIVSGIEQGLFILQPTLPASLAISKSQPVGTIEVGETISYTVVVSNTGGVPAAGVVVTDTLNGVDTVLSGPSSIAAGDSAAYVFTYIIQAADCGSQLSNVASVHSSSSTEISIPEPIVTAVTCGTKLYMPVISQDE